MFNNLKTPHIRDEEFKDMTLETSRRGFHRSPGTNNSVIKGNETRLVRCVHCGFPCDRERDVRAPEDSWAGLGINYGTALIAGSAISDGVSYLTQGDIDSKTVLMLHFDGVDTSTTFTDSELTPKIITAVGNAQISIAQSKFGGASGLFDGTGDAVTTPDHTDFVFGTGDFTIDMWVRPVSVSSGFLISQWDAGSVQAWALQIGTGKLVWTSRNAGNIDSFTSISSISTGVWTHLVVIQVSGVIKFFINGILDAGTGISTAAIGNPTDVLSIGARSISGSIDQEYNGYIDELRISKGIARWTTNFIPPVNSYSSYSGAKNPDTYYERTMGGGCACCGSFLYDKKLDNKGSTD